MEACELPAGGAPRGRMEEAGVVAVFRTIPADLEIGRHFVVEVQLCADGPAPTLTRVDAEMPEHRHGMNYRPTLSPQGGGRFIAEGFLLHMPGRWRLRFDVERGGQRTRLTTDVLLE